MRHLPQVTGIRKETDEAIETTEPIQSNVRTLVDHLPGSLSSFRKKRMAMEPKPMIGKLIQKIHRHDTFLAKASPIKGSVTEPRAHMEPRYPNQA
jgi:hypothetical protein